MDDGIPPWERETLGDRVFMWACLAVSALASGALIYAVVALIAPSPGVAQTITSLSDDDRGIMVTIGCAVLYAVGVMVGKR